MNVGEIARYRVEHTPGAVNCDGPFFFFFFEGTLEKIPIADSTAVIFYGPPHH